MKETAWSLLYEFSDLFSCSGNPESFTSGSWRCIITELKVPVLLYLSTGSFGRILEIPPDSVYLFSLPPQSLTLNSFLAPTT